MRASGRPPLQPLPGSGGQGGGGRGGPRPADRGDGPGLPRLRLSPGDGPASARGPFRGEETGAKADAGALLALPRAQEVDPHHGLPAPASALSEPGGGADAGKSRPGLALRYHVPSAAGGLLLPRGDPGRSYPQGRGLERVEQHRRRPRSGGSPKGAGEPKAPAGMDPPLSTRASSTPPRATSRRCSRREAGPA